VALWDFPGLRPLAVLDAPAHNGPLSMLALSDRGRYLATQQQDNVVTVWETQSRQPLLTLAQQNDRMVHLAFSPDERYLICVNANTRLRLYDLHAVRAELGKLGLQ
jgi:transcription initiation factor TFIID subunit 5